MAESLKALSARAPIAKAIRHALKRWHGLLVNLDDGRIKTDNDTVRRPMRRRRARDEAILFRDVEDDRSASDLRAMASTVPSPDR